MNKHRAKCDVLKKIRKGIADKLGIDLHQRECTFEGDCKGTCPKCKQEEDMLNRELAKRAGALALGAAAGLMLTACVPTGNMDNVAGGITYEEDTGVPPMDSYADDEVSDADGQLLGVIISSDELLGDVAYEEGEEPGYEEADACKGDGSPIPETTVGVSPDD